MSRATALVTGLLALHVALAARGEAIAVLDVSMTGVPDDLRPRFEASLEEGLRGAGLTVVPHGKVAERLAQADAPDGCTFGPCLAAVGRALGVGVVLVARVTAQGPSYSFVFTLVDTTTGGPTSQVSESCAVCTLDEALASATLAVVSLGTKTGTATVPTEDPWEKRHRALVRRTHATGWWLEGSALVAAVAGGVLLALDHDTSAAGTFGAAGGLAVSGLVLIWVE